MCFWHISRVPHRPDAWPVQNGGAVLRIDILRIGISPSRSGESQPCAGPDDSPRIHGSAHRVPRETHRRAIRATGRDNHCGNHCGNTPALALQQPAFERRAGLGAIFTKRIPPADTRPRRRRERDRVSGIPRWLAEFQLRRCRGEAGVNSRMFSRGPLHHAIGRAPAKRDPSHRHARARTTTLRPPRRSHYRDTCGHDACRRRMAARCRKVRC